MPYPETPVESNILQLGSAIREAIEGVNLADFLRSSLQIRELRCAFGLPRSASTSVMQRWLGAPHVFIKLGSGAHFDGLTCEVALPAEQATELVDRVLGGKGRGALPSRAGLPNAAECGVLAYFAARCVRVCAADLRVQDVCAEPNRVTSSDAGVLWPLRVVASDGLKLDLKLLFGDRAHVPVQPVTAQLVLRDELERSQCKDLARGDILVGDTWPLHYTTGGLSGLLQLQVEGCSEMALVVLENAAIKLASAAQSAATQGSAELVVAQLRLTLDQLLSLLAERTLPCTVASELLLKVAGEDLARGRLIRYAGQLALQVESSLDAVAQR